MRIIWSPLAIDRASDIANYIAKDKPSTAEKWINAVFSKVEQLSSSPERWLAMQDSYNLWHVKQTVNLDEIEPLAVKI